MTLSRRQFVKRSFAAASTFLIVPRHVLGKGYTPPSDRLNLAAIGAGGKGESDIYWASEMGKHNVTAWADVDWKMAKKTIDRFPKAQKYRSFREMLDKEKNIDAITISTPDHTHAVAAMAAMERGIHIYVQKPMSHNIFEARLMTEAAKKYQVVTQMGNQGASSIGVHQMIQWFDQGLIGAVKEVHVWTDRPVWPQGIPVPSGTHMLPADLDWNGWIGPAQMIDFNPAYHPFNWRGWWAFGTGALGDMGCHLIDPPYRVLGLGYPTEVECSVGAVYVRAWSPEHIPDGCPPSSTVRLKFEATAKNPSDMTMSWYDGGLRPFRHPWIPADDALGDDDSTNGVMMIGSKGVMTCGVYAASPKIYFENGEKLQESPDVISKNKHYNASADNGQQKAWVEACKSGFGSQEHKTLTSSFDYAGPLTETVLMGNLAIRSYALRQKNHRGHWVYPGRKKLLWDGAQMKITNFDEANNFVSRQYRDGWKL